MALNKNSVSMMCAPLVYLDTQHTRYTLIHNTSLRLIKVLFNKAVHNLIHIPLHTLIHNT